MKELVKDNLASMGFLGKVHRYALESEKSEIAMSKSIGDFDFTRLGAVPEPCEGGRLRISISVPRRAGLCGVKLCICADGCDNSYYSFTLASDYISDTFVCDIPASDLPGKMSNGLYYYHFELDFGGLVLYTESVNNADFQLCENYPEYRFRLLVYDREFKTPDWFKGNIMYHIFVDRFNKGSVKVPVSETALINPDWDNGIPQYGEYPGAFVENNVFFGGTLWGVAEKLDYLQSLGVGCIYLSPIFKAYSNHKYDTGDYMTVDEMFGSDEALKELIKEAGNHGIKIILDGVFNHTGDDSLYFNRYGRYNSIGAAQSETSEYRDWYCFESDGGYKSWWGIEILPKLDLKNAECEEFFLGKNGVLEKYLSMGIGGVRLDVADELPTEFLDRLRTTVKGCNAVGMIIGEVWENAADKIAYGERRKYFRGSQLDSVMNYPQKNAVTEFLRWGDSEFLYNILTELYASYPKQCSDVLMNILGTHDTERILTVLGDEDSDGLSNDELSVRRMTAEQRKTAIKKLRLASVMQYTLFGTPSVYYGDEAGTEGYRDPFCRLPYPWGREDTELRDHYKKLGKIRRTEKVFEKGDFLFTYISDGFAVYKRFDENGEIRVAVNANNFSVTTELCGEYKDLLSEWCGSGSVEVPAMTAMILKRYKS